MVGGDRGNVQRLQRLMALLHQINNEDNEDDDDDDDGEEEDDSSTESGRNHNNHPDDEVLSANQEGRGGDEDESDDAIERQLLLALPHWVDGNNDNGSVGLSSDEGDDSDDDDSGSEREEDLVEGIVNNDEDDEDEIYDIYSSASSVSTTWTENDEDRDCSLHMCACCASDSIDEQTSLWPQFKYRDDHNNTNNVTSRARGEQPPPKDNPLDDDEHLRLCLDSQLPIYRNALVPMLLKKFRKRPNIKRLAIKMGEGEPGSPHILKLLQADPHRQWKSVSFQGGVDYNGLVDLCSSQFISEVLDELEHVEALNLIETTTDLGRLAFQLSRYPRLHTLRFERPVNHLHRVVELTHALQQNSCLTRLSFSECTFFGTGNDMVQNHNGTLIDLVTGISNIPQLVTLKLCRCQMDDATLSFVVHALKKHPSLAHLHLGGNACISNRSIQAVAKLLSSKRSKLVDLNLSSVWDEFYYEEDPTDDGESLDFIPLFQALAKNTKLQKLYLAETPIKANAIAALADALKVNTSLTNIDLRGVDMSFDAEAELVQIVASGRRVERLRISYCDRMCNFIPHLNWAGCQLLSQSLEIPLALWPLILSRVNLQTNNRVHEEFDIPAVLYQMLRCPHGESSTMPLLVQMAARDPTPAPKEEEEQVEVPVEEEHPKLRRSSRRKKLEVESSSMTNANAVTSSCNNDAMEGGGKKKRRRTVAGSNNEVSATDSNGNNATLPQLPSDRHKTLRCRR
jgi:hypothetical protein